VAITILLRNIELRLPKPKLLIPFHQELVVLHLAQGVRYLVITLFLLLLKLGTTIFTFASAVSFV